MLDLPSGAVVKNTPANAGRARRPFRQPLGSSPGVGNGNPLQYSCLEKSHGQRSLVGYSPWGCRESDRTEWAHTHCADRSRRWLIPHAHHRGWPQQCLHLPSLRICTPSSFCVENIPCLKLLEVSTQLSSFCSNTASHPACQYLSSFACNSDRFPAIPPYCLTIPSRNKPISVLASARLTTWLLTSFC